jgi:hypothetical protein
MCEVILRKAIIEFGKPLFIQKANTKIPSDTKEIVNGKSDTQFILKSNCDSFVLNNLYSRLFLMEKNTYSIIIKRFIQSQTQMHAKF